MNSQKGSARIIVILVLLVAIGYGVWRIAGGADSAKKDAMPTSSVVGETKDPNF